MAKFLKIILVIFFLCLIFIIINKFFYQFLKNTLFLAFSSLERVFWQGSNAFSQWIEGFFQFKEIKIENEELKRENLFLKGEILKLKMIEEENKKLREALNLDLSQEYNLILADVISLKEDSLLINQGRRGGVKKDMPVITEEKVLIGKIGKVFNNFSQVKLISQKDFSFSVKIIKNKEWRKNNKEKEEILGMAKGKGSFSIKLEFVSPGLKIKKGDLIVTSWLGGIFPENLLVGEIKKIKKDSLGSFQEIEIEAYFKKLKLDKVFLIKYGF